MRSFLLSTFFSFTFLQSNAQESTLPVNQNGKIEYTEVVQVDSAKSSVLYSRSKKYINDVFVSGKEVTQLTDDEAKNIIAKGLIPVKIPVGIGSPVPGTVRVSVNIQSKDGRYKYSFSDLELNYNNPPSYNEISNEKIKGLPRKSHQSVMIQVDKTIKGLIGELKKQMGKSVETEDW